MTAQFFRHPLTRLRLACFVLLTCAGAAWGLEPVSGDFSAINEARSSELVVWRYAPNPEIYVFDFPNLTLQGRTFNRITQLTEQQLSEPYPRVLSNAELARHYEAARRTLADFAFGHDVMLWELAQFFNLADRDKVELNAEEIALRDFLVGQGLLRSWRSIWQAMKPNAVILSVPQAQEKHDNEPRITNLARYAILLHEMSHGEYYSNRYYATYCQRFWADTLSDEQREKFRAFLSQYNYSTNAEDLLINEMQAYLMFTPDPASFNAKKLGVAAEELEAMREAFRKGRPPIKLPLRGKE